jgi:hypothetical protein
MNILVSIILFIVNFAYQIALQFFNKHSILFVLCILFFLSLSLTTLPYCAIESKLYTSFT